MKLSAPAYTCSVAILCALAAASFFQAAPVAAEIREMIIPPGQFIAGYHRIPIRGGEQTLRRGVFTVDGAAHVEGGTKRRLIDRITLKLASQFAYEDLGEGRGGFLGLQRKIVPTPVGTTMLEIDKLEVLSGATTVALYDSFTRLTTRDRAIFPMKLEIEDWSRVSFVFHVRICMDDTNASSIPDLEPLERRRIVWKPTDYALQLKPAAPAGRPPKPGVLAEITPLSLFPPHPFLNAPFAVTMKVQNTGELPTETTAVRWEYRDEIVEEFVPSLAGGAMHMLQYSSNAADDYHRVILTFGGKTHSLDIEPVRRAMPRLVSAGIQPSYKEEPLVVLVSIANDGTGPASALVVKLSAAETETHSRIPAIPAGETKALSIEWREAPTDIDELALMLTNGEILESRAIVRAARSPRPAANHIIEQAYFESAGMVGAQSRFACRVANAGNLEGSVTIELKVTADEREIAQKTRRVRIAPGETVVVVTEPFPLPGGMTRGDAIAGTVSEFALIDAPVRPRAREDGRIDYEPSFASAPFSGSLMPLKNKATYRFAPVDGIEEIDTVVSIRIAVTTWTSGRERPFDAAVARIKGRGWHDRFEIASTESAFTSVLTRNLLEDTIELTIEQAGAANVFLVDTPVISFATVFSENGKIDRVTVTETGAYLVAANRARHIKSGTVTIKAAASADASLHELKVAAGERIEAFIPVPPGKEGYERITLSLPFSPSDDAKEFTRFVPPNPFPTLSFSFLAPCVLASGAPMSLACLRVEGGRAPELELFRAADEGRASCGMIPLVPDGETAVFLFEPTSSVEVDYGRAKLAANIARAGVAEARSALRLLDLGDDTPAAGRDLVVRFTRAPRTGALPAGRVYVAMNGILRAALDAPALAEGERFVGGIKLHPGGANAADVVLFEPVAADDTGAAVYPADRAIVALRAMPDAVTRADRDWTLPVIVRQKPSGSAYTRAANVAWEASRLLVTQRLAQLPPISPQSARDLERLHADTTAEGRIAYREALFMLKNEWAAGAELLASARLPVTLTQESFTSFLDAIETITALAESPVEVDRRTVEKALETLSLHGERVVGVVADLP